MNTDDLQNSVEGGIQAKRGFRFETYALLFYLLIRLKEHPSLEVIIEPEEGEDAKFTYPADQSNGYQQITELIQYKKRESSQAEKSDTGEVIEDTWREGEITPHKFKKWVTTKRPKFSTVDFLGSNKNVFFTAIIFGDLTPGVRKFIPKDLPRFTSFSSYSSDFAKAFPADYKHLEDPTPPKARFSTEEIRAKIRLLRFASPDILDAQCRRILEDVYGNSRRLAPDIVDRLLIEIARREAVKGNETRRRLFGHELNSIIATGKTEQGRWREAKKLLDAANASSMGAHPVEPFSSLDFESGQYVHFSKYDEAWEGLERVGFIGISGSAGIGKSTLASYLIFRFLKQYPTADAYYLNVRAGETLEDEAKFLQKNIETNTLFVIDDQHLSFEAADTLIQTFSDNYRVGNTRAKLAATSGITLGHTNKGRRHSELNTAHIIQLNAINLVEMVEVVKALRTRVGINTPLTDYDLSALSKGNIGLAIILATCSKNLPTRFTLQQFAQSKDLGKILRNWILSQLSWQGNYERFEDEIVPIFTLATQEAPIPKDFNTSVDALYNAGFLEPEEIDNDDIKSFRPANRRLAMLIRIQNQSQGLFTWERFLDKYPNQLAVLCERLSSDGRGQMILLALFDSRIDTFLKVLNESFRPISLDNISKILLALHTADPHGRSKKLLRDLAAPSGQQRRHFFSFFIRTERVQDVASLAKFFYTLHKVDRFLIRQLASAQLGTQADFILSLFEDPSCRLDQIAQCLHAIKRCSQEIAVALYERVKLSPIITQKIQETNDDPRAILIWLRFCRVIRFLNRIDYREYLEEHLTIPKVAGTFKSISNFNQISVILMQLRNLSPKVAAGIISELWWKYRDRFTQLLMNEPDLSLITQDLYTISRLNKRLAVQISSHLQPKLLSLVHDEVQYKILASSLTTIRKHLSMKLASELVVGIDRHNLLTDLSGERQTFSLAGRSLLNLSILSDELGWWLESNLNYKTLTDRVRAFDPDTRLYPYTHLIRGFLSSANPNNRRAELLDTFLNDPTLVRELNEAWQEANNLTEIAFCLTHLLNTPLTQTDFIDLFGIPNLSEFREYILGKIAETESIFHLVNGLLALAKFDLTLANEALISFVEGARLKRNQEEPPDVSISKPKSKNYVLKLPRGNAPNDLVDLGCMLRVAAAIDPIEGRKLAEVIDLKRISIYAGDEANLGRLAIFIRGLHDTSYKLSRDFVRAICSEEVWQNQLEENESLENIVHYAMSLGYVSRSSCVKFLLFILDKYRTELIDMIEVEANPTKIANWLRLLSKVDRDVASSTIASISQILTVTSDYDTRLRQLLDSAIALIDCDERELAMQFVNKLCVQAFQIRSVHKLQDWIEILHKSIRISNYLNTPEFPHTLFAELRTEYFTHYILRFEKTPLLLAYAYNFLLSTTLSGFDELVGEMSRVRELILEDVKNERRSFLKCLSLILMRAPVEEIAKTAQICSWHWLWERGLASLLFEAAFSNQTNPFIHPSNLTDTAWSDVLTKELSEDTSNIEYALTLHLAALEGLSSDLVNQYRAEALERAEDEFIRAIQWILQQAPGSIKLKRDHYYTWFYIRQTVLRPEYLNWERELEEAASNTTFRLEHERDLEVILS